TVRLDEMGYTDVDDSPAGMQARATFRKLPYPYLYDGDGQTTAAAFGVETTPEIFVFDRERTLRYHGRIDDNADESRVTSRDAQEAIEALLADSLAVGGVRRRRRTDRDRARTGHRGTHRRGRSDQAPRQRHEPDHVGELLGHLVRAVHRRVPRAAED